MFIVQIILGCIRCDVQYMVLPCLAGWRSARSARSAGCWVCPFCCFLLRILAICWASWKFSESRTENSSRKCHLGAPTRYRKMSLNNWTGPMRRSWILVVVLASMQHCHLAFYAFLINFLLFLLLGFTWNILKASKRSKRKWNTVKYFEGPSFLGWEKNILSQKSAEIVRTLLPLVLFNSIKHWYQGTHFPLTASRSFQVWLFNTGHPWFYILCLYYAL